MQPLMRAEALVQSYPARAGGRGEVRALDELSLVLPAGSTLAVVGESGSGKSTLARCLAMLEKPAAGRIWLGELELTALRESRLRVLRPRVQLIFQDASAAMNPRLNAAEIVSEPLLFRSDLPRDRGRRRAEAWLELVGLGASAGPRRLAEFSGGQRQRLALARALAAEPAVLILDESLSALDCALQAQIANLLLELQRSQQLTCVFITHDFAMAAHLADDIAVMEHGRIVEAGRASEIARRPQHARTRALLAAVPDLPASTVFAFEGV
jgi:ABC-type glutathione transport system ATPase component